MKKKYFLVALLMITTFILNSNVMGHPLDKNGWSNILAKLNDAKFTGESKQLPLEYAYNALAPSIDEKTMEIHYSKHHATYTKNMNDLVQGKEYAQKSLFALFAEMENFPVPLKNNSGGFYNHLFFWQILASEGQHPSGDLLSAIESTFGSFDKFKEAFTNAAKGQFGSGWAWLSVDENGKLFVSSTANQENPMMSTVAMRGIPILTLDVWEHAYYLNYQNRRPDYIEAFWKVINWNQVAKRYTEALSVLK